MISKVCPVTTAKLVLESKAFVRAGSPTASSLQPLHTVRAELRTNTTGSLGELEVVTTVQIPPGPVYVNLSLTQAFTLVVQPNAVLQSAMALASAVLLIAPALLLSVKVKEPPAAILPRFA